MADKEKYRLRQRQYLLRLYEEEYELFEKKAASYGMSKTEYLRTLITFGEMRQRSKLTDEQFHTLIVELNHIGVNINQIAYMANATRSVTRDMVLELKLQMQKLEDNYICWCMKG